MLRVESTSERVDGGNPNGKESLNMGSSLSPVTTQRHNTPRSERIMGFGLHLFFCFGGYP